MMDGIHELERHFGPRTGDGLADIIDWKAVEQHLGLPLPVDYKRFVEQYGSGPVDDFVFILHPSTTNENLNLLRQSAVRLGALRALRDSGAEDVPYQPEARPGGLLPWGFTDNGDVGYWHIRSRDPQSWTVV